MAASIGCDEKRGPSFAIDGLPSSVHPMVLRPIPYAAPSTGAFGGISPSGVRHGGRTLPEGQEAPSGNPRRKRGTEETSGIRVAFSLDTFFWRRKRKYLAFGCENPIKSNVAIAHIYFNV